MRLLTLPSTRPFRAALSIWRLKEPTPSSEAPPTSPGKRSATSRWSISFQSSSRQDVHTLTLAIALTAPTQTEKADVRKKALTAVMRMPAAALVSPRGVPSKVLIHSEPDPKVRVLWELDRRILLNQDDRLINALGLGFQR